MTNNFCISLSSIPSRFESVKKVLVSLNSQTIKPSKIFLNIPYNYKRFPEIKDVNLDIFQNIKDNNLCNYFFQIFFKMFIFFYKIKLTSKYFNFIK